MRYPYRNFNIAVIFIVDMVCDTEFSSFRIGGTQMKTRTFILAATLLFFAAQWTGAFVRPMYTPDTGSSSGQQNAAYLASPYSSTSQGADTLITNEPHSPQGSVPAIPEPSTAILIGLGLVGTGITRIRKRQR